MVATSGKPSGTLYEYSLDNVTYTTLGYRTQLNFDGLGGNDSISIDATGLYLSNRYTITETGIDGLTGFNGDDVLYSNVENLDFQGDYGHNDITIDMDNQVTNLATATINGNAGKRPHSAQRCRQFNATLSARRYRQ